MCGDLGNFRYCVGFNSPPNIPFYPASYVTGDAEEAGAVTVGLESADLVFLSFFGADSLEEGCSNLCDTLTQALRPVQHIVARECAASGLRYLGIDASLNPGLGPVESIGAGIETILQQTMPPTSTITSATNSAAPHVFGGPGTLAAVSALTSALRRVRAAGEVALCGYSGLMLPVMEDSVLSARANDEVSYYRLARVLYFHCAHTCNVVD
jgi:uncharacterized protein (UPF0210 family)